MYVVVENDGIYRVHQISGESEGIACLLAPHLVWELAEAMRRDSTSPSTGPYFARLSRAVAHGTESPCETRTDSCSRPSPSVTLDAHHISGKVCCSGLQSSQWKLRFKRAPLSVFRSLTKQRRTSNQQRVCLGDDFTRGHHHFHR